MRRKEKEREKEEGEEEEGEEEEGKDEKVGNKLTLWHVAVEAQTMKFDKILKKRRNYFYEPITNFEIKRWNKE